jgi:MscS family membrane protein
MLDQLTWEALLWLILFCFILGSSSVLFWQWQRAQQQGPLPIWKSRLLATLPWPWFSGLSGISLLAFWQRFSSIESPLLEHLPNAWFILTTLWFFWRWLSHAQATAEGHSRFMLEVSKSAVLVISLLALAWEFNINISALLAIGGLGGLALGLAAKDILANLFGGVMVMLDRPFKIGDWVRLPEKNIEGSVEKIGWRSTTLRNIEQRPLTIPNHLFNSLLLENTSAMTARRLGLLFILRHQDGEKLPELLRQWRTYLEAHPALLKTPHFWLHLQGVTPQGLEVSGQAFCAPRPLAEFLALREEILEGLLEILYQNQAALAQPVLPAKADGQ